MRSVCAITRRARGLAALISWAGCSRDKERPRISPGPLRICVARVSGSRDGEEAEARMLGVCRVRSVTECLEHVHGDLIGPIRNVRARGARARRAVPVDREEAGRAVATEVLEGRRVVDHVRRGVAGPERDGAALMIEVLA